MKSNKGTHGATDFDAIADMLMEKQQDYLEPRLAQLHEMGKCTDDKLNTIQTELASLSGSIRSIKTDIATLRGTEKENSKAVANHDAALQAMELKMADIEDRSRCGNIRVINFKETTEESNAIQFLTRSIPKWFPSL